MSESNRSPEPQSGSTPPPQPASPQPAPSQPAPPQPVPPATPDLSLTYEPPAAPPRPPAPEPGAWGSPAPGGWGAPAPGGWGAPAPGGWSAPPPPLQSAPGMGTGLVTQSERNWAVAAHLSGFLAAYIALGFVGPLVVLLTGGTRSPFVRRHAVEALNFNLTVLIAAVVSAVLVIVLIGILLLPILGILYLVTVIAGAVAASRGEDYRYPLTIRFIS